MAANVTGYKVDSDAGPWTRGSMLAFAIDFPNIGPDIFSISLGSFTFALRWYAMAYIVGILIGWWLMVKVAETPRFWPGESPINREQIDEFMTWVILGIILGGRLGYVIFYEPAKYLASPIDIIKVWQGGMAFHGGLLGVVIAAIIFARRHRIAMMSLADLLAIGTPIGLMLGRTANFINAELWGAPTDAWFGVIFPGQSAQDCGQPLGELCARHPSQLYEAGMEGLILGMVLLLLVTRGHSLARPGLTAGVFFAGYGFARYLVEFVRQADAQFITPENPFGYVVQLGSFGMSMGQVLSLPMLAFGLFLILQARRRT